ncbi:hypothetical protein [Sulfobacillus harzensis]|uniref:Amine oxidase domain-containing protein n=1 Tax=Sulfobacillus harzensis TaxID=2729629 RepID=A0A7Y0L7M7_9FIRM|nr:hypothetical protein [Sulfobacillus harzensis]NMP24818.1 hypothetical protein [Sulfobacillus harzensis]
MVVLRSFWGPRPTPSLWTDDQLLAKHAEAMADVLQIHSLPRFITLRRWNQALPHIPEGLRLPREIPQSPGLYLVGPTVGGLGLSDCVKTAWAVARDMTRLQCAS